MASRKRHAIVEREAMRGATSRLTFLCGLGRTVHKANVGQVVKDGGVTRGIGLCARCYIRADDEQTAALEADALAEEVESAKEAVERILSKRKGRGGDHSHQKRILELARRREDVNGALDSAAEDPEGADTKRGYHEAMLLDIVERRGPLKKGDIEKQYLARLHQKPDTHQHTPYSSRHVSGVLADLADRGILARRVVSYGRHGRTSVYAASESELNELPAMRPPNAGSPR